MGVGGRFFRGTGRASMDQYGTELNLHSTHQYVTNDLLMLWLLFTQSSPVVWTGEKNIWDGL